MRNLLLPISIGLLCTSFTIVPPATDGARPEHRADVTITRMESIPPNKAEAIYEETGLCEAGLSREAFEYAWKGYETLQQDHQLRNTQYLSICDFSQSSKQKRLYVIDITTHELVINTWVAHGMNSGGEYASQFSNKSESLQSSLGFFVTADTYTGKNGYSLRLLGQEKGINDKAYDRTIVIHGADYVNESRLKAGMWMGRSWGCPAVSRKEAATLINTIRNGTCFFIYHPSRNYLLHSKILNG